MNGYNGLVCQRQNNSALQVVIASVVLSRSRTI
jgi:hypothetical protein